MINKLRLTNFRGIKQGEIELSPLTILVGSNNAGKSTILEALFLAPNPARQVPYGDTALAIVQKLHATLDSSGAAIFMLDYRAEQASIECELDGDVYSLIFTQDNKNKGIFFSSNKQNNSKSGYVFGEETNRQRAFAVARISSDGINTGDSDPLIKESLLINPALIGLSYQYLRENWASIMNSGACERVIKEATKLSTESYINITCEPFLAGRYAIYAFRSDGKRIRLGDLGQGMQNYIMARILYEIKEPQTLLWDDIESHFNPRMLIQLSEWFADIIASGKQVVVATHSIEALKILAEPNPEKTSVLLLSLKDNILKTKALSPDEIDNLTEAGIDVRIAEPFLL